ncbi:MAG TPA: sigma-70 family RNA polymerase sigma factor [Kofleriaceae bacterium]|nr:sigma-70 family RNA polymerase sigma factor [Kofleriaceae bacterium]
MIKPKHPSSDQDADLVRGDDMDATSEDMVVPSPGAPVSRVDREREAEALHHVRNGQRDVALKILMVVYGDLLAGFIARLASGPDRTKELYQTVFLRAFRQIHKFRPDKSPSMWAWLCQIAYAIVLEEDPPSELDGPSFAKVGLDEFSGCVVAAAGLAAPSSLMDDWTQRVERCLAKLPAPARTQLLMRFALGLSDAEIGAAAGLEPAAVELNISRIQARLRRCVSGEGEDE